MGYDCSIILPRETYAIGNYTSITVTLLMNKYRIPLASWGHMKISGTHRKCTVLVFSVFYFFRHLFQQM